MTSWTHQLFTSTLPRMPGWNLGPRTPGRQLRAQGSCRRPLHSRWHLMRGQGRPLPPSKVSHLPACHCWHLAPLSCCSLLVSRLPKISLRPSLPLVLVPEPRTSWRQGQSVPMHSLYSPVYHWDTTAGTAQPPRSLRVVGYTPSSLLGTPQLPNMLVCKVHRPAHGTLNPVSAALRASVSSLQNGHDPFGCHGDFDVFTCRLLSL